MAHMSESHDFGVRSLEGSLISLSSTSNASRTSLSSSSLSANAEHRDLSTTSSGNDITTPRIGSSPDQPTSGQIERDRAQTPLPADPVASSSSHRTVVEPHPLASFLLAQASQSPPGSPMSHLSSSSANGSPDLKGIDRWEPRTRSATAATNTTTATTTTTTSGASSDSDEHLSTSNMGDFVMPSLTLPSSRLRAAPAIRSRSVSSRGNKVLSSVSSAGSDDTEDLARVLILGRSAIERQTFARLLSKPQPQPDDHSDQATDLETSVHSLTHSEPIRKRATCSDYDFLSAFPSSALVASFEHVVSDQPDRDALSDGLAVPFERLAATLDPDYPIESRRVADIVTFDLRNSLEVCVMLFSAPAHPREIKLAQAVSRVLIVLPVLVLPPSPRDKAQKTSAIAGAVAQQLDTAGIKWKTFAMGDESTIPVLPGHLFGQFDSGSEGQSLSSSQELPSPVSTSSRSFSPGHVGDLLRLKAFFSRDESRQWIRQVQVQSFLDWRCVDLAARGINSRNLSQLPDEWHERAGPALVVPYFEVDFSSRVSRRRQELEARPGVQQQQGGSVLTETGREQGRRSSLLSDLMTPRCSDDPGLQHDSFVRASEQTISMPGGYFGPTSRPDVTQTSSASETTLTLPSLLSLVGLNLRLALLPRIWSLEPHKEDSERGKQQGNSGVRLTWLGAFAWAGAIFVTGYFVRPLTHRMLGSLATGTTRIR